MSQALLPRRPGTAWFLNGSEKTWLQGRQDTIDAKAHARDARSGKWWGCMLRWELWYLSVCYALVQWSITAVVYFNPVRAHLCTSLCQCLQERKV